MTEGETTFFQIISNLEIIVKIASEIQMTIFRGLEHQWVIILLKGPTIQKDPDNKTKIPSVEKCMSFYLFVRPPVLKDHYWGTIYCFF